MLSLNQTRKLDINELLTGVAIAIPLGFNLDSDTLKEKTNGKRATTVDENYTVKDQDGNELVKLNVYLAVHYYIDKKTGNYISYNPYKPELSGNLPFDFDDDSLDKKVIHPKLTFWLSSQDKISRSGAYQKRDVSGKFSFPKRGTEEYPYLSGDPAEFKNARRGEAELYDFLKKWLKLSDTDGEGNPVIHNIDYEALLREDFSELNNYAEEKAHDGIQVLLGVQSGQYQGVYSKEFIREEMNPLMMKSWFERVSGEYGYNADFQGSLKLQRYQPFMVTTDTKTAVKGSAKAEKIKTDLDGLFGLDD